MTRLVILLAAFPLAIVRAEPVSASAATDQELRSIIGELSDRMAAVEARAAATANDENVLPDRMAAVEARAAAIANENVVLRQKIDALMDRAPHAQAGRTATTEPKGNTAVNIVSPMGISSPDRRLSASQTEYIAVPTVQVHEFPNGHGCSNTGEGYKALRPLDAQGAIKWGPSPTVPSSDLILGKINTDWSANEIQTLPAPFKLVHGGGCVLPPTLELQLNTSVRGTLSVNGNPVSTAPRTYVVSEDAGSLQIGPNASDTEVTRLTKTVTLSESASTVIFHYALAWHYPSNEQNSRFVTCSVRTDDGSGEVTQNHAISTVGLTGQAVWATNTGLHFANLGPGTHVFKVYCTAGITVTMFDQVSSQLLVL